MLKHSKLSIGSSNYLFASQMSISRMYTIGPTFLNSAVGKRDR